MAETRKFACPKCDGKKTINAFTHVQGGVCFHCGGAGYVMQKTAPKKSQEYEISFLWTDPADVNYMNGEFCNCGKISARSRSAAEKKAAERMSKNGAAAYKLQ